MRTYTLTTPRDDHGQPIRVFKAIRENNAAKAIDQLCGICAGILADGVVTEEEAKFFANWVQTYAPMEPVWPFTDILARVERIFSDGRCDAEELDELKAIMEALCGHIAKTGTEETQSTKLPLDFPPPDPVVFSNRLFNVTGKFALGPRRKVMVEIEQRGGIASDSAPTRESHYLVIGIFASRDWAHTNYGRKIEHAVDLRKSGSGISIISEQHLKRFIA
jgi:hypothetical protein